MSTLAARGNTIGGRETGPDAPWRQRPSRPREGGTRFRPRAKYTAPSARDARTRTRTLPHVRTNERLRRRRWSLHVLVLFR